jgi:hypothetical protein
MHHRIAPIHRIHSSVTSGSSTRVLGRIRHRQQHGLPSSVSRSRLPMCTFIPILRTRIPSVSFHASPVSQFTHPSHPSLNSKSNTNTFPDLDVNEYHALADETLDRLVERLEDIIDDSVGADASNGFAVADVEYAVSFCYFCFYLLLLENELY